VVGELLEDDEELRETVMRYVDLWIGELAPLDYIDGMAEVVGDQVKVRPWQVFHQIDEDELSETLDYAVRFKRAREFGKPTMDASDLEVRIERILRALGVSIESLSKFEDTRDPNGKTKVLVTALALAIGIAAVRRNWAQE